MRDGNLIEQHISDLVWITKILEYTGMLSVKTDSEQIEIYLKDGNLVYDNISIHPVDLLYKLASIGYGEFIFYDNKELEKNSMSIQIHEELPAKLIEKSNNSSGFPMILYSQEVMSSRFKQISLTRFPRNISPSTEKLYKICSNNPTIYELFETFKISPKTIIEVANEGIQVGVLQMLSSDGKIIPKAQVYHYTKPSSYHLRYFAKVKINKSLTARKGRIHISDMKFKMMDRFAGQSNVNAKIGNGYFSTDKYKLDENEILITKTDLEESSDINSELIEVTLVKGA